MGHLTSPVAVDGLTGLGSGVATFLATPSSANLKTAVTDETGSGGALVFATSPSLTTPTLGVASTTSISSSGNIQAPSFTATAATGTGMMTYNITDNTSFILHTFSETSVAKAGILYMGSSGTASRQGFLELRQETATGGISLWTNATQRWNIGNDGGLYSNAATGGTKGNATVNAAAAYYSNGTIGVGTVGTGTAVTLPLTAFTTAGGLVTVATGTSDERLKEHQPFTRGLEAVRGIRPIRYRWNEIATAHGIDGSREEFGFSAQSIVAAMPEAGGVERWDEGGEWLTGSYYAVLGAAVNAIKELDAEVRDLRARLQAA